MEANGKGHFKKERVNCISCIKCYRKIKHNKHFKTKRNLLTKNVRPV